VVLAVLCVPATVVGALASGESFGAVEIAVIALSAALVLLRHYAHVPLPLACRAPFEQRPQLLLDRLDALLERGAVAVLLELLPGVEDVPGHFETVESKRFLRSRAEVGVVGEVAAQVRPTDLTPFRLEAVVGAEAVRAEDAGEAVADEPVQVLLAAVGRNPQHRRLFAEGAPERARLATEVPTRLVDVERARATGLLEQFVVDRLQRLAGAGKDRLDRPHRDRTAEQLLQQLDQLPARETVTHRQ